MHTLFEVSEVADHVRRADQLDPANGDELEAIRIGMVLMALGGMPGASAMLAGAAWHRLHQASRHGLLQVFLDQDGICRGYAIFALLDDASDALARSDPRVLGEVERHVSGSHPWLLAISGGIGQGWALARHLRDNFLRHHDRVTYLRRLNGKSMLKTLTRKLGSGVGRRRDLVRPPPNTRFTQFRLNRNNILRFCDYVRLQHESASPIDLGRACENFNLSAGLLQCYFDREENPRAFLSWAMVSDEALERLETSEAKVLRSGDWNSGTTPYIIERLGSRPVLDELLGKWHARFSARNRLSSSTPPCVGCASTVSDEPRQDCLPQACSVLACEPASVPIHVARLPDAAVAWPDPDQPTQALILAAAVRMHDEGREVAWADRYGGAGIGGNGGSGRAGLFGGVYVKGIGPTPLIGRTTNKHHVSGGAYLEEAVRETIFAELLARELPWGAVRTMAIIDTLEDEHWAVDPESDFPIASERRVLLIREPVLRLAHLQRAIHFTPEESPIAGVDVRRVNHNRAVLAAEWGAGFEAHLRQFWLRWCDQAAYLYVWRLTQGAPSTSNIAFDGRLLDFGAASALPDWCAAVVFSGAPENGFEFQQIAQFLHAFYSEHRDGQLTAGEPWDIYAARLTAECRSRYLARTGAEMLRLAGLRRRTIEATFRTPERLQRLEDAVTRAIGWYLRQFRITIETDSSSGLWDFPKFWDEQPPLHLRRLRSLAAEVASASRGEPIRERMRVRCKPRAHLSREIFRRSLHRRFAGVMSGKRVDSKLVADIILRETMLARRDTPVEPATDVLHGFAAIDSATYALFRRPDGTSYAVNEQPASAPTGTQSSLEVCLPWTDDGAVAGKSVEIFHLL